MNRMRTAVGVALTLAAPAAFAAVHEQELELIRQQIQQMRSDYEQRIQALELRLLQAEAAAHEAQTSAEQAHQEAQSVAALPPPVPAQAANAFNPAISLILDGAYSHQSRDPGGFAIPGFALGDEAGPGDRGLGLGESELALSANVDNLFYGALTAAIAPEGGADVEEAYLQTLAMPHGLGIKAGRFFSGIGYLNSQHAHAWDFVDPPLAYRAMLGNQYGDDGVQLTWTAPTDLYVSLGGELFRGDAFPAGGNTGNDAGTWTAFLHVGGDVGVSNSWSAGLSHLRADATDRETGDGAELFSGDSKLSIADFVWKWAPNGNPYRTNFKFQSEYLWRSEDGEFNGFPYDANQRGWYAQGVYQFLPRWRVGLRYDELHAGDPGAAFADSVLDPLGHTPRRGSLMVDFANTEFSRLRLQYDRDESQPTAEDEWYLQYIMSLGSHGAHKF